MFSKFNSPLHRALNVLDWQYEVDDFGNDKVWAPPEWGEILLAPRTFVRVTEDGRRWPEQVLAGGELPSVVHTGCRRLAPDLAFFAWRDAYATLSEVWVPPGMGDPVRPEGRTWEMSMSAGTWCGWFTWRDGDDAPRGHSLGSSPVSPRIMNVWRKVLDWILRAKEMRAAGEEPITAFERYQARGHKCLREGVATEAIR